MDKRDLVELTIERLLANFETSPESFDLKGGECLDGSYYVTAVIWRPRVQLNNYDFHVVDDPNNNHSVVVTLCPSTNRLSCFLYLKGAPLNLDGSRADFSMSSLESFMRLRSHYRKFKKLTKLIKARDLHKENMQYLSKLSSVFPDVLDKHILKD